MSQASPARASYRERLWPAPTLFIALLLIIPAVMLAVTPLNADLALPVALGIFAIVTGSLLLSAPTISVSGGELTAGSARIPVALLGAVETLGADRLRATIGPGADARAFLLVRGYIHRGVKLEVVDPEDPAPYWVLTSRRPAELAAAIEAARG